MVSIFIRDDLKAEKSSPEEIPELSDTKSPPIDKERSPKTSFLSPEELSEVFRQCITDLDQPECRQALKNTFEDDHKANLTQCICLGLGSFASNEAGTEDEPAKQRPNRSLHQLAVLTVILGILGAQHPIHDVYFQDPIFTKVEKDFLQSLGYTVLEDPAASRKMSTSTFLFAPFLGYVVAANAMAVALPVLSIGNGPAAYLYCLRRCTQIPEPTIQEFEVMTRVLHQFENATFAGRPLPSFDSQSWTQGTTVHWLYPASEHPPREKE